MLGAKNTYVSVCCDNDLAHSEQVVIKSAYPHIAGYQWTATLQGVISSLWYLVSAVGTLGV